MDSNLPWCIHTIRGLTVPGASAKTELGVWVKAVCEPYTAERWRAAWWVLTGRAYAFRWPEEGDLEMATDSYPDIPKQEKAS